MTNNNLTDSQLEKIIEAADEVLTALAGTNDDVHPDNSKKMCDLWDDLNDTYAPPEVVKAMTLELQQRRKADELSIQTAPALYSLSKTGEVRCSNYPVIPDGYCIMPVTLTAENGAKRALSGEFSIPRSVTCPECGGDGCSDCDGRGDWNEDQIIDWPTIKLIYQKAVEACAIAATQKQDKSA
ncbi:TPA: hypothetical protein ACP4WM_000236 [Escherichia coli]|uniref:hypothetical protein n=1 Tax=Escherichia coli TaxID=562 RepID=UPI0006A07B00|nr:hypothetical protein [Escherichia coli]CTS07962.1 putative DnaJ-class molecular chaperone with C-terminal Zn finger domain [Escherichia coli]